MRSAAAKADLQRYVFNGVLPPWHDAERFFVSLHFGSPGPMPEMGQAAQEIEYQGYRRAVLPRPGGMIVDGRQAVNDVVVQFPACTGGIAVATHIGIGLQDEGPGYLIYFDKLDIPLTIGELVAPVIMPGMLRVEEE